MVKVYLSFCPYWLNWINEDMILLQTHSYCFRVNMLRWRHQGIVKSFLCRTTQDQTALKCFQQNLMIEFDWLLFLVFTNIHFSLSTENIFSFQQKTFFVFIAEHISFSPQFILRCQLKSFSVFIQNQFWLTPWNQFWLSSEIIFCCHPKSILVVTGIHFWLSSEIFFCWQHKLILVSTKQHC